MGKPFKPQAKGKAKPREPELDELGISDSDNDQDDFKAKKSKVNLNLSDDDDSEEEVDEEAVYDLSEDGEDDEDEEEDDDEDDDIEDALGRGGTIAKLAKQAKVLGQKLKLQQREEGDEGDHGDEEEDDSRLWGANKRAYYDTANEFEVGDEDEDAKAEEAEALRMQREKAAKLSAADYGLDEGDDEDSESEEEEETMGSLAKKAPGVKGAVQMESVAKDLGALSSEERMAALMADAPELMSMLQELQDSLAEVRHRLGPLLSELRDGGLATSEGLSYLEAKHLLLLSYSIHIVFYLLLKAEGRPVRDHPVITRLVELRAYMEKIRPIDKQLQYQIDKLLKAAQLAAVTEPTTLDNDADGQAGPGPSSAAEDPDMLRYGPRPDALVAKTKQGAAAGDQPEDGGVYRPPRLNPVSMELDERGEGRLSKQEQRRLSEAKSRAGRSETLRALAAELTDAPQEERLSQPGFDSMAALKQRQRLEARSGMEEDLFQRVPLSREEAKKLRAARRTGLSGAGLLEDFGDEVADLVDSARGAEGGARSALNDLFARQKVSQKFGADHQSLGRAGPSGDEDLPKRETLGDRRAKFDNAAARKSAHASLGGDGDDMQYDAGPNRKRGGEEDDLYQQIKASATERKRARREAHTAPALHPPLADPRDSGARAITTEIERNRGLTPHRRRDIKNPRKKNRVMFEKAMVRVKGAVQPVRTGDRGGYGGEATGIKTKVAKGRKLG